MRSIEPGIQRWIGQVQNKLEIPGSMLRIAPE